MHKAKSNLSKLVSRALEGEEIIIAKSGKPVAKLIPINGKKKRQGNQWKGKVWMAPDFDQWPKDIMASLTGENNEIFD